MSDQINDPQVLGERLAEILEPVLDLAQKVQANTPVTRKARKLKKVENMTLLELLDEEVDLYTKDVPLGKEDALTLNDEKKNKLLQDLRNCEGDLDQVLDILKIPVAVIKTTLDIVS